MDRTSLSSCDMLCSHFAHPAASSWSAAQKDLSTPDPRKRICGYSGSTSFFTSAQPAALTVVTLSAILLKIKGEYGSVTL